jgi:hypothetical protein
VIGVTASDTAHRWFVTGRPTPFAGGENERNWKVALREQSVAPTDDQGQTHVEMRFALASARMSPSGSDLDNLIEPVVSVLVNGLGWAGGRRPNLQEVAASKRSADTEGVQVAFGAVAASWSSLLLDEVLLDDIYLGPPPRSATEPQFTEWVVSHMGGPLNGRPAAVRLWFSDPATNLGEIATGRSKPLIDCLWPVLGGRPGAPDDWRIQDLVVRKGGLNHSGVAVFVATAR